MLATLATTAIAQVQAPPAPLTAVYRDDYGMPHIVAETEYAAWYALGYEQARDGLLWVQYTCKAAKGQLTWVRGEQDPIALTNDFAVGVFDSYRRIANMSDAARRQMFAPSNATPAISIQGNFYDNCIAFAAGADAYRREVQNAPAQTTEGQLRLWLDAATPHGAQGSLRWVYQHPISPVDIAAMGGWTAAVTSFRWPNGLVNSSGGSYGAVGSAAAPVESGSIAEPMSPAATQEWFDQLRQHLTGLSGAPAAMLGSNTFAWSKLYCQGGTGTEPPTYPGLVGDPHQGIPSYDPDFRKAFFDTPNHIWMAHVQVKPSGAAQPTLDVLGHVPHGSAAFFTCHNRNIAVGGTAAAPNVTDWFLLRLKQDTTGNGTPLTNPYQYYSYYHDNPSAPTNQTWMNLVPSHVDIMLPSGATVPVPYWRAGPFGAVLPASLIAVGVYIQAYVNQPTGSLPNLFPLVYGERFDRTGTPWRVGLNNSADRMRFWGVPHSDTGGLLTDPMVVALRAPIDAAVDGSNRHYRLLADFWEIAHASDPLQVLSRTDGAAYPVNLACVDRNGVVMATQCSAIPERGDDNLLYQAGYRTLDKWRIYSKIGTPPVPARHYGDLMFDWRFEAHQNGVPTNLSYLQYRTTPPPAPNPPSSSPATRVPFKPMTLQVQGLNAGFPTVPVPTPTPTPFTSDVGFFVSACNDQVWGFSRKRDRVDQYTGPAPAPFVNWTATNNPLFQWVLDAGVAYQTAVLGLEGPDRQQIVVERLTRTAERMAVGGSAGLPPLTPAQMRQFVVSPGMYREPSYAAPAAGMAATQGVPLSGLPTPIRQLKEVMDNTNFRGFTQDPIPQLIESPFRSAGEELLFFSNLMGALQNGLWDNHPLPGASGGALVNLRQLWINGTDSTHNPQRPNQVFWYDSPATSSGLRWIDMPADFPLIDFAWDQSEVGKTLRTGGTGGLHGSMFDSQRIQTLNGLVAQLVAWDAAGPHYENVPSSPGACLLEMMRQGYNAKTEVGFDYGRHWVRLKNGVPMPGMPKPWSELRGLAFPFSEMASLFRRAVPSDMEVPYDALYSDVSAHTVRTTLRAQDINALVKFFLALGNCYVDPGANGLSPSRKKARFDLAGSEGAFMAMQPPGYPLTDGLRRLSAVLALLDAGAYLGGISASGIPRFDQCFVSRAYDRTGQVWPPAPGSVAPCVGGGLRAVEWNEDLTPGSGHVPHRGYQPRFLGGGGSIATLLAMFPSDRASEVDSYFWCTPGVRVMSDEVGRFQGHMDAFSQNVLQPTRYHTFMSHQAWSVVHEF